MDFKQTLLLRAFGLTKIPMLFFLSPTILKLNKKECAVKIGLNYRTKNHLGCMYFGALSAGADCAGGLMGMEAIKRSGKKVDLLFKDFHADFRKRAEGDVVFTCTDGAKIQQMVKDAVKTGRRINKTMMIVATTPKVSGDEPVAIFELTLSLKARASKKKPSPRKKPSKKTPRRPARKPAKKAKRAPRRRAA